MADDPTIWDIATLRVHLNAGSITAQSVVESHLNRIESRENLNAYIHVMGDSACRAAQAIDGASEHGPLAGVPIAVKDNILVENEPCTCASRMLKGWIAPYDATAVARLRAAGAIIIGKTNHDEFGMGGTNEHSHFGPALNPIDPTRVPGGSSGGSAVAVADCQAMAALGSDTGGSVRLPASYCGIVGLKPTYGAVSRWGLVAFASSLDQIGFMARTVDDVRRVYHVTRGQDSRDGTSIDQKPRKLADGPRTVGIPQEFMDDGLDPPIRNAILDTAERLRRLGHSIIDVSLPALKYSVSAYYIIACAEASSNLARYDGVTYGHRAEGAADLIRMYETSRDEGFGEEVKRRILLGTYVLSSGYMDQYYGTALRARDLISTDFDRALSRCDCLLTPTAPNCAYPLGSRLDDPLEMYLMDVYTTSVNLAGLPALSVPCGTSGEGLPIGAQFIGRRFDEDLILDLAERSMIPMDESTP